MRSHSTSSRYIASTHNCHENRPHLVRKCTKAGKRSCSPPPMTRLPKTIPKPSSPASVTPSFHPSTSKPKLMRFQPLSAGTYGSLDISRRFFTTLRALRIGACIKVSAAPFQTVPKLGTLVSQGAGGSALVMDYGADHAVGNSIYSKLMEVPPNNYFFP